ncbi:MAG: hypothetical protein AAFY15_05525 [Cyanobacteria bacterium J06648_11]
MPSSAKRNAAVVIVAGILYYYIYSNLVGMGAAIAAPEWFIPFMREHRILGLNLFSLATTVPAAAIGATIMGFGLSRILKGQYFFFGLLAVCVMVVFSTLVVDYGRGFWGGLRMTALPHHLAIPMFFAQWLFLPLATMFFGRRMDHLGKQAAFS